MAKLNDIEVDDYLAQVVSIEPTALDEEFTRLPSDLAYYNQLFANAQRRYMLAKMDVERVEARLTIEVRETLAMAAGSSRGPTVDAVKAEVASRKDYQDAHLAEIDAEIEAGRLKGVLEALRTKRDMLIQLGANVRAEMAGDAHLREVMMGNRHGR